MTQEIKHFVSEVILKSLLTFKINPIFFSITLENINNNNGKPCTMKTIRKNN